MIKEIHPPEAYQILQQQQDAVLIDVRSTMEYEYVGHPVGAIHVPVKEPPGWETRADFVQKVRDAIQALSPVKQSSEDLPILMLCRSGKRSELGGEMLIKDGFKNVYNILEGFEGDRDENGHRNTINGWRFHGLPWEQS